MYLSTRSMPGANLAVEWNVVLADHWLELRRKQQADFEASLDVRSIGGAKCVRAMQSAGVIERSAAIIGANPSDDVILFLQVGGAATLHQGDRRAELAPGVAVLMDPMRPSQIVVSGACVQLALHIPRAMLARSVRENHFAKPLAPFHGALIAHLLETAFEAVAEAERNGKAVLEAIAQLVEGGLDADEGVKDRDDPTHQSLYSAQQYALHHLGEDLSPSRLAKAANISERHLHRVFQESGITVSRWIRERRLDRCAAMLRNPRLHHHSLTQIAFSHGFNDVAHFSRVFKDQFGQSPSCYRRLAQHPSAQTRPDEQRKSA